jgi:hypothetical protein
MKSFKRYITEVATFTAKNFPSDIKGNETFSGAGERTVYVPTSDAETFKWKDGFPLESDTYLMSNSGDRIKMLRKGEIIHFTYPAKLFRAQELGIRGASIYAAVSTKKHNSDVDGFIQISSVIKPAGGAQKRVGAGSETQMTVAQKVEEISFKNKTNYEFVSVARVGSTAPDLIVKIDGKKVQFEIKGTNNETAPITFFDKSLNRRRAADDLLDSIAKTFADHYRLQLPQNKKNILGVIDYYRAIDNTIGLAGDSGAPKSGKLPKEFTTKDTSLLNKMRTVILDHFVLGGDNYFVIHNRSNDSFRMYFTNNGENLLNLPELPSFKSFSLATYGGASSGSTRVGLKIQV